MGAIVGTGLGGVKPYRWPGSVTGRVWVRLGPRRFVPSRWTGDSAGVFMLNVKDPEGAGDCPSLGGFETRHYGYVGSRWNAGRLAFGWGEAPALQPPLPTLWIPTFAGMTKSVAGVYPGSESRTCFHSNRSCRLRPACQSMESWSCGLVRRIGTAVSATPLLRPSGGQAPALHLLVPLSTIGLRLGRFCRGRAGIEVDWRAHPG